MKHLAFLLLSIALAWPLVATAEISYDYLQLDVIVDGEMELSQGTFEESFDTDGLNLEASALFHPNIFGFAASSDRTIDFDELGSGSENSFGTFSAGVGGRYPFDLGGAAALDLYGTLSYESYESLGGTGKGHGIGAGVRWMPTDNLEVNAGVKSVDYGSFEDFNGGEIDADGLRYNLRAMFNVTEKLALGLDYRIGAIELESESLGADLDADEEEVRLSGRWYY